MPHAGFFYRNIKKGDGIHIQESGVQILLACILLERADRCKCIISNGIKFSFVIGGTA